MATINLSGGKPPENPDVVRAMKGAAIGDNPNTRGKLYNALLEATFLLPVSQGQSVDEASTDNPIHLLMARSENGHAMMLLFTDEASLQAWQPEGIPYVTLVASDAFTLAAQYNVEKALINPAGPDVTGDLTAYELQALARGLVPGSPDAVEAERMVAPSEVGIAPPEGDEELPGIALKHIQATLAQHASVQAAYLFMMTAPSQEPTLICGVAFTTLDDPNAIDQTMRSIVSTVSPALHGRHMNFMVLHGDLRTAVEGAIDPLYMRDSA